MKRLVSLSLKQPLFMALLTVLFIAAGVLAFRSLPVEAFPDVTDVQVTVITLVPGHAPEEVEKQVTIPLEIGLSGLPHSVRMFSMVSYINQMRESGTPLMSAVTQGAETRLRTVLMTSLLAMFGLLPMALSHGIGSETQRPLGVVIIGGLVSATVLTLIVLPTLYVVSESRKGKAPSDDALRTGVEE